MTNTLVIAVVLTAAALTGILATTAVSSYATSNGDSSETNTNCGQNLINSEGVVCFDPTVNATDDD
jgi:hypothetical protein